MDDAPDLTGTGTSEEVWTAWLEAGQPPPVAWGPASRLVVVAPHPDDEVLGLGGSIAALRRDGWDVRVVAVTDGEASHPASTVLDPTAMAALRIQESTRALAELAVGGTAIDRLGLPDGEVGDHEADLAERLSEVFDPADVVAVPHVRDGHPDHDATARAGLRAADQVGAVVVHYPVWLWHWATPDSDVGWDAARVQVLDGAAQLAKARAISAFASQIDALGPAAADQPILPPGILARFQRTVEVVFT